MNTSAPASPTAVLAVDVVFGNDQLRVRLSDGREIAVPMEWFPRLLREPRRLYKRVFLSGPEFLFDLFLYLFKIKKA